MKVEVLSDFVVKLEGSERKLLKGQIVNVDRSVGMWFVERKLAREILPPPTKIHSDLLGEEIWLANSTEQMTELILLGVTEPIYVPEEIARMKEFDKARVKATNMVKRTFPGSLILKKSDDNE